MVGALGYGCARTDLAISRNAVSTLVVSSNGGGMLARIQSSLVSDTAPADARGIRLVLPPCVFCGAVNTSLVEQTRQFLFVGCPHCSYLFSMPKPQNDAAQH